MQGLNPRPVPKKNLRGFVPAFNGKPCTNSTKKVCGILSYCKVAVVGGIRLGEPKNPTQSGPWARRTFEVLSLLLTGIKTKTANLLQSALVAAQCLFP